MNIICEHLCHLLTNSDKYSIILHNLTEYFFEKDWLI